MIILYIDIFMILNRSWFDFFHTLPCSRRIDLKVGSDVRMTINCNVNW